MKRERLYLIDLFKLIIIFCISTYHGYSLVYFNTFDAAYYAHTIYGHTVPVVRIFVYGGLIVMAISFVLLGFVNLQKKKIERLLALIIFGAIILMISQVENPLKGLFWDWDVYQFLAASIFSLIFLYRRPKWLAGAAILGFVMSCFSFFQYADDQRLPLVFRAIVFGVCDKEGRGGWALLPWIGLPWMSFFMGAFIREHRGYFRTLPWKEVLVWGPLLILGIFTWGGYYYCPYDNYYYCYIFRRSPQVFWGHFVWIFFVLRLAFVDEVNQFLGSFPLVRWLASLRLTTHFGLCYLMQLIYVYAFTYIDDYMHAHLAFYDVFVLSILPASEWMGRGMLTLKERIKWIEV